MINLKKEWKNILLIVVFVLVLGVSINVFAESIDCNKVVDDKLIAALNDYVYTPIKWATPILLLVLTSLDFARVVFAGKKEDMDKAKNNFMKRFVAALVIFFAPDIIIAIVNMVEQNKVNACLNNFK